MKRVFEIVEKVLKEVLKIVTPLLAIYRLIKDIVNGGKQ